MTSRQFGRPTRGQPGAERPDGGAERGPGLPELLATARERKGVDLFRAERETKIRARYLAALESGDYRELPGAVYTKGFLRNYALYLGLDPEEVLDLYHHERGEAGSAAPAIAVPRPLAAPRQGLTITPGVIAAGLLTLGVVAFAVYLGLQLFRFAKPPTIAVSDPPIAVIDVDETTTKYTLRGTSSSGASITVDTPGRDAIRGSADVDGNWSIEVDLRRGQNRFNVTATDPETGKQAEAPATILITVPFSQIQAPTLALDQPADGAEFKNGAIPIEGLVTNATSVTVSAEYLGGGTPVATPIPTAAPDGASPSPKPSGDATTGLQPLTVTPADDGTFTAPFELTAGKWRLTVTALGAGAKSVSISRTVSVKFTGVSLVVTIKGGKAWLKAWVDGKVDEGLGSAGKVIANGKSLTFTGETSVEVRTGQSAVTFFSLNGTDLGNLGGGGTPTTWLFQPPNPPSQTSRY